MLAAKLLFNPARMLGLQDKGHLSPGADADLTLLDATTGEPALSFSMGEMIMRRGIPVPVCRRPTMLIHKKGVRTMQKWTLPYQVVDLGEKSSLYGIKADRTKRKPT